MITALVVGLLVLIASAVAGDLGGRALRGYGGPQDCGGGKCLPVQVADLVKAERARGFDCRQADEYSWSCELHAGATAYVQKMEVYSGRLNSLMASAEFRQDAHLSATGRAYFEWVASLPFGQDQQGASAARGWVDRQIQGRGQAKALINSFEYEVRVAHVGGISLDIKVDPKA